MYSTEDRIAIVLGVNWSWVFAAATLMMGIRENLSRPFDLIILESEVKEREQALLNHILPCQFIEFGWPMPETIVRSRGTQMNFSRFVCFDLLENYDKVIWMDSDMMVVRPMDGLFDYGKTGMGMVPHEKVFSEVYKNHRNRWECDPAFNKYDLDATLLTAGLMVFSRALADPVAMGDWCFEKSWEWSHYNVNTQPIVNIMVQEFELKVEELPLEYNCPLIYQTEETIILHPWGRKKFWNELESPVWDDYYRRWLELDDAWPR